MRQPDSPLPRPAVEPPLVPALPERRRRQRVTPALVSHGPAALTINQGSTFMVAAPDGSIGILGGHEQGLYAEDTRFLSRYELRLNDRPLHHLASARLSFRHARSVLSADEIASVAGAVTGTRVTITHDRAISSNRLHEDVVLTCYGTEPLSLMLAIDMGSDFADIFEVRTERWQRRADLHTVWLPPDRLETRYTRNGFVRRHLVRAWGDGTATYANGALNFAVDLAPGQRWRICLQHDLLVSARMRPSLASCPFTAQVIDRGETLRRRWHRTVARAEPADLRLAHALEQAVEDFAALRLYAHDFSHDVWLPAAGIPWFVAVFGRDSLIASLQALPVHPLFAVGTLQKLAAWQATEVDPVRDAEPGKICHEMRVGEWAQFHTIPHSPYYGTADATPLYLLLLAETYRWLGDPELLHRFRDTAVRCLEWIDRWGDRDGDGLQEYAPQTPTGYRNQSWRDAEDGVLDEQGGFPPHPIGTCDMQAYVYGAKRGIAALFEVWGEEERAAALVAEAEELRRRFIAAYWLPDAGDVAFAIDGSKRALRTATSTPGHCLWMGILDQERGQGVADRLMRSDIFSGWGLRTLSTAHPAYDPHSYQRGSVWPHDTMIAAAGLRRYGRSRDAWRLIDGLLAAVTCFESGQMPELFAGLERMPPDVPVPYSRANVPQAWAAGSLFHAVRILLGLEPDAPSRTVYLDPALPPWCPTLRLDNVRVGGDRLRIDVERLPDGTHRVDVESSGPLHVVRGRPPWTAVAKP